MWIEKKMLKRTIVKKNKCMNRQIDKVRKTFSQKVKLKGRKMGRKQKQRKVKCYG